MFAVAAATVLVRDGGAVVQQDRDVDAHDGDDTAHVEVHHEDALEGQGADAVVHDLGQAECQHQEYEELSVHGAQSHPKVGAKQKKKQISVCV